MTEVLTLFGTVFLFALLLLAALDMLLSLVDSLLSLFR